MSDSPGIMLPENHVRPSDPEPPAAFPAAASVWLLTNAPSPYQAELLTEISAQPDIELSVRLMRASSSSGAAVNSGFKSITMTGVAPASWRDEIRLHPRALWEAAFGRFDCYVLSGLYTSITFLCCAAILAVRRKPWIVWLERPRRNWSNLDQDRPTVLSRFRDRIRKQLLAASTRILCIGTAARTAYASITNASEKLDVLPYCCDLSRYDRVSPEEIRRFRCEHELDGRVVFLFSGQLISRKGVDILIDAFEKIDDDRGLGKLLILGDGPLRRELEDRVDPARRDRVRFLGHLRQEQLPVAFRSAEAFVFPSRHDGWAVVINEACAAGLPIVASEETGAAHDLVRCGENGFRHPAADVDAFRKSMELLLHDAGLRSRFGSRSRELVEAFSPARGAEVFAATIRKVLA